MTVEKPTPDGCLTINFNKSLHGQNDVYQHVYMFPSIRHWQESEIGLIVFSRGGRQGNRVCYPWGTILYYDVEVNSEDYHANVIAWHEQEDHEVETVMGNVLLGEPSYMVCKDKDCDWSSGLEEHVVGHDHG